MKNKKIAKMLLALGLGIMTATSSIAFAACSPTEETQEQTYTVTFDLNYTGATGAPAPSTGLKKGDKVNKPQDPTREGYTFDGWYLNDQKWTFESDTMPEQNITLKAKWTANSTSGGSEGTTPGTGGEGTTPGGSEGTTPGGSEGTGGEGTGGEGGGSQTTKTEKATTLFSVDFSTASDASSVLGLLPQGVTLKNGDSKAKGDQQSTDSGKISCLNFGGAGDLEKESLEFNVEEAGKVKITLEYFQSNAGRYMDVFAANTDTETQAEHPTVILASGHKTTTTSDKSVKTAVLNVWTTAANTKLYVGSHSSGIYLKSIKVEKVTWDDDTAVEAAFESIEIIKNTKAYTLVNSSVTIDTSDVMVLTADGTNPVCGGYTVATTLKDSEGTELVEGAATKAGSYTLGATATKSGADTLTATDVTITVANVTSATAEFATGKEDELAALMCDAGSDTLSFDATTVKLFCGGVELLDTTQEGPWTFTYAMTKTSGTDYSSSDQKTFTLTKDSSYTLTVTATNSDTGITAVVKTATVNVSAHVVRITGQLTTWPAFTANTVLLQNTAQSGEVTAGEGEIFKVTLMTAATEKTSAMKNDISTNHAQIKKASDVIKFELAEGYTYKVTIYAGCSSSGKTCSLTFNNQEKTSGEGDSALALTWDNVEGRSSPIMLTIGGNNGRIGGIIIVATKNAA